MHTYVPTFKSWIVFYYIKQQNDTKLSEMSNSISLQIVNLHWNFDKISILIVRFHKIIKEKEK
jgi:hypothetical protein